MVINEKAKVVERYEYRYNDQDQRDREVVSGGLAELPAGEGTRVSEYNALNQLLATSSPEETFVYDDDGNMAEGYTPEGYRFTASYDQADRLVQLSFTDSDGKVHLSRYGYRYDSFLARIEKLVDGTVVADIRIIRDGKLAIQERDGENRVSREYLWGLNLGGGIGGLLQVRQEGGTYACLYDGKGNVSVLLDEAGETVAQYRYDAFGKVLATSGSVEQPFQFSTKRYDAETGLNYYGYRFYSPAIERWMNRDPLGEDGGINLYGFVENNPVNWVDPWGLEKLPPTKKIPGNKPAALAFLNFTKSLNTCLPIPLELAADDMAVRNALRPIPGVGLVLGELFSPTPLGDGTLCGVDLNGDGISDYPEACDDDDCH